MSQFADAIARAARGEDLSADKMAQLIDTMLRGEAEGDAIGDLLRVLQEKGESVDELVGAARALRRHMTPINARHTLLLDTCGTGGSGSGTFNISTASAIVIAAAGVPVAKHGNRRATSRSGSADVLSELGVAIESDRETVEQVLEQVGLCFCFAPKLHPAMRHVAEVRRRLGIPTLFNLLGPLCNPAGATHQVLGTGRAEVHPKIAEALRRLGTERSVVVRGSDGQDEVTLAGTTHVIEIQGEAVCTHQWTPDDFGLPTWNADPMQAADPAASAAIIRDVFAGHQGPCRDIVVANAAAGLWLVGKRESLAAAARLAEQTIDRGAAAEKLEQLAQRTQPQES